MLNEEKALLAALLRLFIANPTGNQLTRSQMMDTAKVALAALAAPKPEPACEVRCMEDQSLVVENVREGFTLGRTPVYTAPPVLADLLPPPMRFDAHPVEEAVFHWNRYLAEVKRRLTLLDSGNWKMVPVVPTPEMMLNNSGCQHHAWDDADCPMRQTRRLK